MTDGAGGAYGAGAFGFTVVSRSVRWVATTPVSTGLDEERATWTSVSKGQKPGSPRLGQGGVRSTSSTSSCAARARPGRRSRGCSRPTRACGCCSWRRAPTTPTSGCPIPTGGSRISAANATGAISPRRAPGSTTGACCTRWARGSAAGRASTSGSGHAVIEATGTASPRAVPTRAGATARRSTSTVNWSRGAASPTRTGGVRRDRCTSSRRSRCIRSSRRCSRERRRSGSIATTARTGNSPNGAPAAPSGTRQSRTASGSRPTARWSPHGAGSPI